MQVLNSKLALVERICDKYMTEKNGKVAYLFARNKSIVSGPMDDVRKITEPTDALKTFANARSELGKEYADRDEDGMPQQEINPMTGQPRYKISRLGAFSLAVENLLNEKHPQAKADQEEIDKRMEEAMEEHTEVDFYTMDLKKVPGYRNDKDEDNGIIESGDLVVLLELGILKEDEPEKKKE